MRNLSFLFLCTLIIGLVGCKDEYPDLEDGIYAEIKTNRGTFLAELFYQQTPVTVANFVSLAEGKSHSMVGAEHKDKKFYDGLTFHRVIEGFMIQGGDPTGTGSGDPGYKFPDEIVDSLSHDAAGYLSMANAGPGTNGSQFFITLAPTPWLNGKHTIFGKVLEGQDVVDAIGLVQTGEGDKPLEEVLIENIKIIRKGDEAKDFNAPQVFEDELASIKAEEEENSKKQEASRSANIQKLDSLKTQAQELESGLKIAFVQKGEGPQPQPGDMVQVDYTGYFADGTMFDTSKEDVAIAAGAFNQERKDQIGYNPMVIPFGPEAPVIPGFKEGLQQMKIGDKAVLFIPSHLGYGARGAGNVIPPDTDLIFEMEMIGIQE